MAAGIPARLTAREGRRFGLTLSGAFLALAALGWWRDHSLLFAVSATLGGVLAAAGLVLPSHLGPVYRAWMGFAERLSRVTTPIFLAVVYFVVVTPTGLLMRLFGRRPMRRPRDAASFWVQRPTNADAAQRAGMQRQF